MKADKKLATKRLTIVPSVFDALSARIAEQAGFDTLFVSGSAISASLIGMPDIGVLTATELAETVARIRDRVDARLIVDADSGYGNTACLARTIRSLEAAGAGIVQIEDQLVVKPRHALSQRPVASVDEMVERIKIAMDARRDGRTLISARTDALSSLGFGEAVDRIGRYAEAGADLLFVQSLSSQQAAEQLAKSLGDGPPLVIHLPDVKAESDFDHNRLGACGFIFGLLPRQMIDAAARSMAASLRDIGHGEKGDARDFDLDDCIVAAPGV